MHLCTSPDEQNSENLLDYALYAVIVHTGASIQMGHYVACVKDPREGWFKMDDHKTSPVSHSEVLKVQAYMLFYIHGVPTDAGIGSVKQQTEQVSESMDKDGIPEVDEHPWLPESTTRTDSEPPCTNK